VIILTLNCGSSSLKYQVFDWDKQEALANGIVERISLDGSFIKHNVAGKEEYKLEKKCATHKEAIDLIMKTLVDPKVGAINSIK
jgi:acetate kinase